MSSEIIQQPQNQIINKKWSLSILLFLHGREKTSYRQIKKSLQIADSSLNRRLNELTKEMYLEKFVYGSISKPHCTEYEITSLAVNRINNLLGCKIY